MTTPDQAETVPAKHVYLDIEGFTLNRSVEAQHDIIRTLNAIIGVAIQEVSIPLDALLLLPTGDGMCISILGLECPFDNHVQLALRTIDLVDRHNQQTKDLSRQFKVRIGISVNTDNLIQDINGRRNIAGRGINTAARIMNVADGGQVLLSAAAYEVLRERERYMNAFRGYTATIKHGAAIQVYQLVAPSPGLSLDTPRQLAPAPAAPLRMTSQTAWYMAHAIAFKRTLLETDSERAAVIWLWYRSRDHLALRNRAEHERFYPYTHGAGQLADKAQLAYYEGMDYWMISDLAASIIDRELRPFSDCFVTASIGFFSDYRFVSDAGAQRLQSEGPDAHAWAIATREENTKGASPTNQN